MAKALDLVPTETDINLLSTKKVLNVKDVCLLTGLSLSTIYQRTAHNKIPFHKLNNKLLFFDREEIENWLLNKNQED